MEKWLKEKYEKKKCFCLREICVQAYNLKEEGWKSQENGWNKVICEMRFQGKSETVLPSLVFSNLSALRITWKVVKTKQIKTMSMPHSRQCNKILCGVGPRQRCFDEQPRNQHSLHKHIISWVSGNEHGARHLETKRA